MGKMNYWTEEEVEILVLNSENMTIAELSNLLPNRSSDAVRNKVISLKLNYIDHQKRWNEEDISTLIKCNGLKVEEVIKLMPHRNKSSIKSKARELNVNIVLSSSWEEYEDVVLKDNCNGKLTISEIQKLIPHRTEKAIKVRMTKLGLSYVKRRRKNITKEEDFKAKESKVYRYKNEFGITLDYDKGVYTYSPIEWWKLYYYGNPNGRSLNCLPVDIYSNEEDLKDIMRYALVEEFSFTNKEDFLSLSIYDLKKYKLHFKPLLKNGLCSLLNDLFPKYNFKPFELKNVPLGYWKDKNNCDEYLKYIVENEFIIDDSHDVSDYASSFFNFKNLRRLNFNGLTYPISEYKHYDSYYFWLNSVYPKWNLKEDNFSFAYGFDGTKLNSKEERDVYDVLGKDMNLNIESVGMSKSFKFYDRKNDSHYIPDFVVEYEGKKFIVEYFGLYRENYGNSKILKDYYYKTLNKVEYFSNLEEYGFIPIYREDTKDKHFLMNKVSQILMEEVRKL